MTTHKDTAGIIERLEAASGPDRELDGAIALSFGWTFEKMKGDRRPYYRKPGNTEYYLRSEPPHYTSSIDAALSLVPEDAFWRIGHDGEGADPSEYRADVLLSRHPDPIVCSEVASTPAITLCIAALRARAHKAEG